MRARILFAASLGLAVFFHLSDAARATVTEVPAAAVDALFAEYDRSDSPGCSVGVVADGELIHARGYGMADLDHGLALTPRSVYRIASTSKQFTAAAVLLLARQGKLDLDADIRTYLPRLRAYDRPVTVRHLIHHTSGYRDYLTLMTLAGLRDEDWVSDDEAVDLLSRQRELNFAPGTEYLYSNSGYFLLSQIVKAASGKTLRQYADEALFRPLGMRSTHFHDDHNEIVPQRATGYAPRETGGYEISVTTLDMVGDGGVFTTVEDLVLWDRAFYAESLGEGFFREMLTTAVLPDGEDSGYAFGLAVDEHRGVQEVSHGGAFVGYRAQMVRYPDHRLSVICLCNRADANPSRLARQVAALYLADHFEPEPAPEAADATAAAAPDPDDLAARVGAYQRRDEGTVVKIVLEEGRLVYTRGSRRYPLRSLSATRFLLEEVPVAIVVEFAAPSPGRRVGFRMEIEGEDEPRAYDPVELVSLTAAELAAYGGDYACDELGATLRITAGDSTLSVAHAHPHKRPFDEPLEPTFRDVFAGGEITMRFTRAGEAPPRELRLDAGRVKNLLCVRAGAGPG